MGCFKPITLKTGEEVPCGRCPGCLSSRRAGWTFRLLEEDKVSKSSHFVTLTYDQENIPELVTEDGEIKQTLDKTDLQKYFKKVRKKEPGLKYYAVGEYGDKNARPHYHGIIFNASKRILKEKWDKGRTQVDRVSQASIHYVTKYMINDHKKQDDRKKPFAVMSKGLGANYIKTNEKFIRQDHSSTVVLPGGYKQALPRYYKDKIYTLSERGEISKRNSDEAQKQTENMTADEIRRNQSARTKKILNNSKSTNY